MVVFIYLFISFIYSFLRVDFTTSQWQFQVYWPAGKCTHFPYQDPCVRIVSLPPCFTLGISVQSVYQYATSKLKWSNVIKQRQHKTVTHQSGNYAWLCSTSDTICTISTSDSVVEFEVNWTSCLSVCLVSVYTKDEAKMKESKKKPCPAN